ncbi:MAG: pilin, partial [Candidatus Dojkabacteria bacterium]|nr:pilin [Candidatus Dojkabacteria bacterium]
MQNIPFSGNDPKSYYCQDGTTPEQMEKDEIDGFFYCKDGTRAIIRPPTIQQFEILFKRIVYVIWAIVASLSFVMLVYLGYKYMIARDTSDRELVKLRKAILNYIFGFSLVFLSVPILTTLFKLLNLNTNISCYDIAMPGFQFFFPELCTDPIGIYYVNPKQVLQLLIQKAKSIKEKQNVELLEAYKQAYNEFNSTVCDINKYNQPITEKDIIMGCEILYTL